MDEPTNTADQEQLRPAPDLPQLLLDPWPLAIVGTGIWALLFVIMLTTGLGGVWRWTTLAGTGLGLLGMTVMLWQRIGRLRPPRKHRNDP